jgi:hypothetical protein
MQARFFSGRLKNDRMTRPRNGKAQLSRANDHANLIANKTLSLAAEASIHEARCGKIARRRLSGDWQSYRNQLVVDANV